MSQEVTWKYVETELIEELEERLGKFVAQVVGFDQAALDGTMSLIGVLSEFLNAQKLPNPVVFGALASVLGSALSKSVGLGDQVQKCN